MCLVPVTWPVIQTAKSTVILWTSSARKRQEPLKTSFFSTAVVALGPRLIHFNVLLLQSSEHNRSLDDMDEEENHVLPPLDGPQVTREPQGDVNGPSQVVRCGGEDGENGGAITQRQRLKPDMPDSSLVRRGRGRAVLVFTLQNQGLIVFLWSEESNRVFLLFGNCVWYCVVF